MQAKISGVHCTTYHVDSGQLYEMRMEYFILLLTYIVAVIYLTAARIIWMTL